MSDLHDAQRMLDEAEQAAMAGNLSSADELLRNAARIQEAELGPLHPDLANTLNNLAIVAEKAGRPDDAEASYRRAAAIATAALPADHPMVAASRQNLEDFCHARGLPIDAPAFMTPSAQDNELGLDVFASEDAEHEATAHAARAAAADFADYKAPLPSDPLSADLSMSLDPDPPLAMPRRTSPWLALVVFGVVAIAAVLLIKRPWSSADAPPAATATVPAPAAGPVDAAPARPAPASPESRATSTPAPAAPAPPTPSATPGDDALASAQVCRTFSTSGGRWQCDPAGDSVAPGALVFLTRIRSPRDATVEHRWYQGETLRRAVKLAIRASPSEGYRTYSRQNVSESGEWRVEVRRADGELLHTQRFAVR